MPFKKKKAATKDEKFHIITVAYPVAVGNDQVDPLIDYIKHKIGEIVVSNVKILNQGDNPMLLFVDHGKITDGGAQVKVKKHVRALVESFEQNNGCTVVYPNEYIRTSQRIEGSARYPTTAVPDKQHSHQHHQQAMLTMPPPPPRSMTTPTAPHFDKVYPALPGLPADDRVDMTRGRYVNITGHVKEEPS